MMKLGQTGPFWVRKLARFRKMNYCRLLSQGRKRGAHNRNTNMTHIIIINSIINNPVPIIRTLDNSMLKQYLAVCRNIGHSCQMRHGRGSYIGDRLEAHLDLCTSCNEVYQLFLSRRINIKNSFTVSMIDQRVQFLLVSCAKIRP